MNDGGKEHINTEENNKSSKNDRSLEKKNSELGAESNDNLSADIPDEADVDEVIKKMPPQIRRSISMMMTSGRMPHPLFDKFNEQHIDKFLDGIQRDDDNEFKMRSSNRWFQLVYVIIAIGFLSFLIFYLLPTDRDMFIEVLKIGVAFLGGIGSGYGLKSYLDRKNY
ncbi:hypothetical protein BMS3Abin03_01547 [bacterium BMS3Abin03]|nr:hypothetical protein BMS3Abin03_01547 [bacterium BMS3Abin03]